MKIRRLAPILGATILSGLVLSGCEGFRLDMHVQPKLKTLRQSDFFGDDRAARPLPAGTIARGELRDDTYYYTGMIGGKEGDVMPLPVIKELLERG
jgi:hypothetical protein